MAGRCMQNERQEMVLSRKPIGRKRRESPGTRWLERAEEDVRHIIQEYKTGNKNRKIEEEIG